jgi:hypothetical protein
MSEKTKWPSGVPKTAADVQARADEIRSAPEVQRGTKFEDLSIDTLVGLAHDAGEAQEKARIIMRLGADVYDHGSPEMWVTWEHGDQS